MKDSLPDLQVGNITDTNILATVRLVAQFCVAVHKEYQGLRREVRALRAETHSLSERLSQHSCDATGDAPRTSKLPETAARNRSDSDLTETNDSCDSGASATKSGGVDENVPPHRDNEADASESSTETEVCADVHVNGTSKSSSTDCSVHANDNDSTEGSVKGKTSSTVKKSIGRNVRVAPSGPRAKRRLLPSNTDSDQSGDGVISKVCKALSKTLEDDEQSNSSASSFDKWCPMFKISKETPAAGGDATGKRRSEETGDTGHSGSGAKSGRVKKRNYGPKSARLAARVIRLDSSDELESSGNSDGETGVASRRKSGSSSGKLLRRLSSGDSTKSKGFPRINLSNRNNKQRSVKKKVVGPRKRKSLPNGHASDSDNQEDSDADPTVVNASFTPGDTDLQLTNCSVVIGDDISSLTFSATNKRRKSNQQQESPQSSMQDIDDESDMGGVVKLWDAGYVWQLCKLMTQMLDEGGAKYLTFADAKITNDTRSKLAQKLCRRTLFRWDSDREVIKRQHSSRPPGARDMERVLSKIHLQ